MRTNLLCAALLLALGGSACPRPPAQEDASHRDAGLPDRRADAQRDTLIIAERDGDGASEDAGPVPFCPLWLERLTLIGANQQRRMGLAHEAVTAAVSDDDAVVAVDLQGGCALLRAVGEGLSSVELRGAAASHTVLVEVRLERSPFATEVVGVEYGEGAGFGQDHMPGVVLGPPQGSGGGGSLDVLSLGIQGRITLSLGVELADGPGPDLIVFENPFPGWVEAGQVSVSLDGETFEAFACQDTSPYAGCAGLGVVSAGPDNDLDPTDPAAAGGDAFDLAALGLRRARYVRVEDVAGVNTGGGAAGFDLDAVAAVHALPAADATLSVSPASLTLAQGERARPRFDLIAAARSWYGVAVSCEATDAGVIEIAEGCDLRGLSPGTTTVTARLADLEVALPIEIAGE